MGNLLGFLKNKNHGSEPKGSVTSTMTNVDPICEKCGCSVSVIDLNNPCSHSTGSTHNIPPPESKPDVCEKCGCSFSVINLNNPQCHEWRKN